MENEHLYSLASTCARILYSLAQTSTLTKKSFQITSQFGLMFMPQLLPTSAIPIHISTVVLASTWFTLIIYANMLFPLDINLIPQSLLDTDHVLITLLDVSIVNFAESIVKSYSVLYLFVFLNIMKHHYVFTDFDEIRAFIFKGWWWWTCFLSNCKCENLVSRTKNWVGQPKRWVN